MTKFPSHSPASDPSLAPVTDWINELQINNDGAFLRKKSFSEVIYIIQLHMTGEYFFSLPYNTYKIQRSKHN